MNDGSAQLAVQMLQSIAAAVQQTAFAYPNAATPVCNGSANKSNADAVATLPASSSKTTWISGFDVTGLGATSAGVVTVTVANTIGGTLSYTYAVPAGATTATTPLSIRFPYPIPASAVNTTIVVTVPAVGSGNTNTTVSAYGYQF